MSCGAIEGCDGHAQDAHSLCLCIVSSCILVWVCMNIHACMCVCVCVPRSSQYILQKPTLPVTKPQSSQPSSDPAIPSKGISKDPLTCVHARMQTFRAHARADLHAHQPMGSGVEKCNFYVLECPSSTCPLCLPGPQPLSLWTLPLEAAA